MIYNIIRDHKKKSKQVKRLKKKLKNIKKGETFIPLAQLEQMLVRERRVKLDPYDYHSWGEFDNDAWTREYASRDARIELLEDLIRGAKQ